MFPNLAALPQGTRLQNGALAVGPVLGQGGFGITYKGGDLAGKRYVAIKEFFPRGAIRQGSTVIPSGVAANFSRDKSDFLHEAQTLARFQNPSIVGVFGTFEENNSAYMVMEFLEGQTLGARIKAKGALDEWEVLDIGLRLAGALEIVHGAGILHRDIKPENVMLARGGRAVLIDFGTARAFEGNTQRMTQIVTPGYAPIEQYASNARRGAATDIYALGATLYHALSGAQPVAATDRAADVALPHLRSFKSALTPVMADAIMSALEMDMARRPQSAREFVAKLQGVAPPPHLMAPLASPAPAAPLPPLMSTSTAVISAPTLALDDEANAPVILFHNALEYHTGAVNALAFDPAGARLISAGTDRLICVWNRSLNALSSFFAAHEGPITSLDFSPDGGWIASGGRDEKVCLWDATLPPSPKPAPLATLSDCQGVVHAVAFCPTRRELLVSDAGAVTLWDASSGGIKARREMCGFSVSWSPDGDFVAIGAVLDGTLHLCNGADLSPQGELAAHQGALAAVAFSPDGGTLATAGSDGFLRLWNVAEGVLVWQQLLGGPAAPCLSWSPDGHFLAAASLSTISLWTARGELWRRFQKHKAAVRALRFAPHTSAPYRYVLASASRDKTINVCRIKCDVAP